MNWDAAPEVAVAWAEALTPLADAVRRKAATLYPPAHVGWYGRAGSDEIALHGVDDPVSRRCMHKVARVREAPLTLEELTAPDSTWTKLAYSQTLRNLGTWLNFFPGHYPGGIPNAPSPLAAMLTSGLLGAGLGWGTGKLLGWALPRRWGRNLGRTGAILGGLLGAAPGAVWSGVNLANGRSLLDPWPLNTAPDAEPEPAPVPDADPGAGMVRTAAAEPELAGSYRNAVEASVKQAFGATFGNAVTPRRRTPLDVNIDSMGRTLWALGAPPALAATTMGALHAAQQLPGGGRPDVVTGDQLGRLAAGTGVGYERGPLVGLALNAVKDYFKGAIGGAILNATIGTPLSAATYGAGNAALGLIGGVVSRLFGP